MKEQRSQTKVYVTRGAGDRRTRLRGHATIRVHHLRLPSNKGARRGRPASLENQLVPVNSLSVARPGFPIDRHPATNQPASERTYTPAPCRRHRSRRRPRHGSPSFETKSDGDAIAELTLRSAEHWEVGNWLLR